MYHVFSFFEGKQHLTHFATEQDVADEFIALLSEARDFYLQDVIVMASGTAAMWMISSTATGISTVTMRFVRTVTK